MSNLVALTYLDCSFNRLVGLPGSICQLSDLRTLLLIDNQIDNLPRNFGNMKSLTELNLFKNNLEDLPTSMKQLKDVEIVDLDYNPMTKIPALIRDEGWGRICEYLASSVLARSKIKLQDHAQTVGEGSLGQNTPKMIELQVKMEEVKRVEEKKRKGKSETEAKRGEAKRSEARPQRRRRRRRTLRNPPSAQRQTTKLTPIFQTPFLLCPTHPPPLCALRFALCALRFAVCGMWGVCVPRLLVPRLRAREGQAGPGEAGQEAEREELDLAAV